MSEKIKIAIINVGIGAWYPKGSARQKKSIEDIDNGYEIDIIQWNSQYPIGSLHHNVMPYQFKPFAFAEAIIMGYDIAIWMDSSVYAKKSIEPIINLIISDGHFMILNGWMAGEWLCDNQLAPLELTRDESFEIPQLMGCVIGLDFRNNTSIKFLKSWTILSDYFKGGWTNTGDCSEDNRVLGSRHDQAFASVISHRLGMKWNNPQGFLSYSPNDDCILIAQGM